MNWFFAVLTRQLVLLSAAGILGPAVATAIVVADDTVRIAAIFLAVLAGEILVLGCTRLLYLSRTKLDYVVRRLRDNARLLDGLRNTPGSVARLRQDAETQIQSLAAIQELLDTGSNAAGSFQCDVEMRGRNAFSPSLVSPRRLVGKPHQHVPGRIAAFQDMGELGDQNLVRVLSLSLEEAMPRVLAAASDSVVEEMASVAEVELLSPSVAVGQVRPHQAYCIIEEASMASGTWAGTLDAAGTSSYQRLVAAIERCKDLGVVVVVVAQGKTMHHTWDLRSRADLVFDHGEFGISYGEDAVTPVLAAIRRAKG